MELASVTFKFKAQVSLTELTCAHCDFVHPVSPRATDEYDNYEDAQAAGIVMAERHGGGDVTVVKFTRVEFKNDGNGGGQNGENGGNG